MGKAFTISYDILFNKLCSDITIQYNEKTIDVKGQWDTGATNSCISNNVVEKLSLIPIGKKIMSTPSGKSERNTYLVDLLLPNHVKINDLEVIDSNIGEQGIGLLVGMDIIMQGDFAVSNYQNKTTFTFRHPSEKKTDYVMEALWKS